MAAEGAQEIPTVGLPHRSSSLLHLIVHLGLVAASHDRNRPLGYHARKGLSKSERLAWEGDWGADA